jgi:activator of HSP90 ATPase
MAMSAELELLDQLGGGPMPYLLMERHVFEGDRSGALRSIEKMQADELIVLAIGGRQVEEWRLSAWRRSPDDTATTSLLEQAELSITDLGVKWLTHGPGAGC